MNKCHCGNIALTASGKCQPCERAIELSLRRMGKIYHNEAIKKKRELLDGPPPKRIKKKFKTCKSDSIRPKHDAKFRK